jgi:hypothetical protein
MQDNIVDFVKETVRLGGIPTEENLDKLTRVQKLINEMTVDNKFNVADMIRSVYQLDAVTFAGYYAGVKVGNTAIGVGGSVKQYIIPQAVKDIIGSKSLSEPLTPEEINALSL